ncbi:hypothetical protein TNCV_5040241 [Trichonephila clavipes]|nr:hypothetical protein TNCV_5040241 [Trichonephila clavipes]
MRLSCEQRVVGPYSVTVLVAVSSAPDHRPPRLDQPRKHCPPKSNQNRKIDEVSHKDVAINLGSIPPEKPEVYEYLQRTVCTFPYRRQYSSA